MSIRKGRKVVQSTWSFDAATRTYTRHFASGESATIRLHAKGSNWMRLTVRAAGGTVLLAKNFQHLADAKNAAFTLTKNRAARTRTHLDIYAHLMEQQRHGAKL